MPIFPVVDFADTPAYASEELTLFDTDHNGVITMGELAALNSSHGSPISALTSVLSSDATPVDHEKLLSLLNTNNSGASTGVIDVTEAAALLGGNPAAVTTAKNADRDGDGKIDPVGFEVKRVAPGVPEHEFAAHPGAGIPQPEFVECGLREWKRRLRVRSDTNGDAQR